TTPLEGSAQASRNPTADGEEAASAPRTKSAALSDVATTNTGRSRIRNMSARIIAGAPTRPSPPSPPENIGKRATLPRAWASEKYPDPLALRGYLEQNDMLDLPAGLVGFLDFYDRRHVRLL